MTRKTIAHFSAEFKREAVRLLEQSNKEVVQLARELGTRRNQLHKWQQEIQTHGETAFPGQGNRNRTKSIDDTIALKAELKKLREENETLKKDGTLLRERLRLRYVFIAELSASYSITRLCAVMQVS